MKKIKVAHVLLSLNVGGMEKVIVDIIKRFNTDKIESIVFCVEEKGEYSKKLEENNIDVFLIQKNNFPMNISFSLGRLMKSKNIDVVHSYSGVYRDATLAGIMFKIPVIIHTDQGKFYPDSKWSRLNHWFFSKFRDRVTVVSDELKNFLIKEVGIKRNKIIRIYNAVDVTEHDFEINKTQKKEQEGIPLGDKVVGIVARLVPVKDHINLFNAFSKVRKSIKNIKLLVVGDGPLKGYLENASLELGEKNNIFFLGNRSDVKELLHIMDVVCLSSLSEGLSLTLIEAMATSKPVVATNVGGNPELINDRINGLLVPPSNSDAMAAAIIKLFHDEEMMKSMGENARLHVEKEFDLKKIVGEYEDLYFELLKKKSIK